MVNFRAFFIDFQSALLKFIILRACLTILLPDIIKATISIFFFLEDHSLLAG